MKMRVMIMGAVLLATAGAATAQMAPRMPADYDILNRVSIFSRDRQAAQSPFGRSGRGNRGNFTPRVRVQRNYTPVLVGTMVEDDGYIVGFIADPATGLMTSVRIGDVLPNSAGTVTEITLDDMTTTGLDHATHKIDIGETILGGSAEFPSADAPATTETASTGPAGDGSGDDNGAPPPSGDDNGGTGSSASGPPAAASAGPAVGGGDSSGTARLPGESILDYLKRRRALQLKK
jgi:hypothetical protein